jgi:hypothetical protein
MVKNAHAGSGHRDEYWETTREQLKSAENRADLLSLLGVAAIGGLLWYYHEPGDGFGRLALTLIGLALVMICVPAWVAARRKRRISATRGLTCPNCGYVPHDTEISEVASTRHCQRCEHSLD